MICDFHLHSNRSDGTLGPAELMELAAAQGVGALALTDHDDVSGVPEAQRRGCELGVEVLTGVELSVSEEEARVQMHILGFGVSLEDPRLDELLAVVRARRVARAGEIVDRLRRAGVPLDPALIRELAPAAIGRPHIARALVRAGVCKSAEAAFGRYLRRGAPAFVPSPGVGAREAIEGIHGAGGIAVLAHPPRSGGVDAPGGLESFIWRWLRLGLDGLEVWHPRHSRQQVRKLRRIARRHELVETGGSDFHGETRAGVLPGHLAIGPEVLNGIREALARRH